jgi:hypothetical protein
MGHFNGISGRVASSLDAPFDSTSLGNGKPYALQEEAMTTLGLYWGSLFTL